MIQSLGPNTWRSRATIVALGLAAATLCHPSAGAEDAGAAPRAAMTDAMARMMEAMGMFFQPAAPGLPLANPLPPPSVMPGTLPKLPGSMPWSSSKDKPGEMMEKGGDMIKGIAEGMANMNPRGTAPLVIRLPAGWGLGGAQWGTAYRSGQSLPDLPRLHPLRRGLHPDPRRSAGLV